jgi:hypothetical protein
MRGDHVLQKKRGTLPQKTLENAFEVLQLAHKSYANSQQLFDQYSGTMADISTNCCQMIKDQLSKHTSYQVSRKCSDTGSAHPSWALRHSSSLLWLPCVLCAGGPPASSSGEGGAKAQGQSALRGSAR